MARAIDKPVEFANLAEVVRDNLPTPLDPRRSADGEHDRRWHMVVNTEIEHDL